MKFRILLAILVSAIPAALTLNGQTVTGTILGTVTDASGDRVPNATVKAVHSLTGETRSTATNAQGDYIFPSLPVGQYRLETQAQGFKQMIRQGISLDVNQNARIDMRLEVGQVTQEVIVTSDAPLVDTRQAQVGGLMDTKRINDLPLNGRNVYSLVELLPGVSGSTLQSQPDSSIGSNLNVNGSRQMQSSFMLDGGFHNAVFRNGGLVAPNPDTVEEFRLITSNYNAEYGRSAGGVVNVITKSGSNQWHGSLFEFLRNDAVDSRGFFQPSVSKLRQNQFGGSVGGPIKRDKLFFFYSYQGDRIRNGQFVNAARTPTVAQRLGDFSTSPANQRPRDPLNNQLFPNGIIPSNRLDTAAVNLLKLVALPNTPDGRVEASSNGSQNSNQHFWKADYLMNPAHRVSVSTFLLRGDNFYPFSNQFLISNIPNYAPQTYNAHQNSVTANETWTVSPSVLNQFTFSYVGVPTERADTNRVSWPDFGSRFVLGAQPPRPPRFVVSGGWTAGSNGDVFETDTTYLLSDVVGWVRGAHSMKTGASLFLLKFNYNSTSRAAGLINVGNETGNPFSDFLLGRSTSFDTSNAFTPNLSSQNWAGFFQDDWKVSRRVTLNLGLRYEVFTPFKDEKDRFQQFRFNQQSKVYPNAPRSLVFPGDEGVPRGLVDTDKNNFAPRVGVSVDVFGNGRTALRAGYGLFYPVGFAGMANSNFGQPFQIDVIAFGTPSYVDPYANSGGNPFPLPAGGARFILPIQAAWMDNMRTPYVQMYSLMIQQQLMQNLTMEVGYVGNTSRKLELQRDTNQPIFLPGRSTAANVNDRRPYMPGTYGVISDQQSAANANYNSLQATLNRRFAHGFTLLANYTWSKAIDTQSADQQSVGALPFVDSNNTSLDRSASGVDLPHAFNLSMLYETPMIKSMGPAGKILFSGWQINALARYASGRPFTVTSGRDSNLNGVNNDRPDQIGKPKLESGRPRDELLLRYFDPSAFAFAANGANGTVGRNTLYGPGSSNWNVSFFKNFPIVEGHRLQFRAEFSNFFNHPSFGNPVSNLGNANVGRILNASAGRIIQFGLRYWF